MVQELLPSTIDKRTATLQALQRALMEPAKVRVSGGCGVSASRMLLVGKGVGFGVRMGRPMDGFRRPTVTVASPPLPPSSLTHPCDPLLSVDGRRPEYAAAGVCQGPGRH